MNHLFLRLTSDGSGSSIRSIVLSNPSGIPSSSFQHSKSFLPTFQVLPSNIPSPSFQQEEFFLPTGKNFPSNWKKFSFRQEKNFLLSVRKPFKFSKIENFLVERQKKFFLQTGKKFPDNWKSFSFQLEKFFLPTGKVFPSNWKNSSFRQDTNECPTYHQPSPFQSQKNRQPQHHNRLTKTKHLHFLRLTFYNLNFVRVDVNSERSMRVLYDFVPLP
ncbi:hypothetical protein TVAG_407870 [Trichomonas vaginalis G3]|uniref:Uncharacterized protein n=1 Tax=Trichomonas vaginalis (strain ATCC PRA-98 / G3) TaxID=412133 RepID=A2H320_TRIV3|nr:hypothetical protein TVAG_407870 [Trichomonas vaginalis G3]|eukprot:XP_001289128.1 hypothetical protein [Trichomonas vaginalis G3]